MANRINKVTQKTKTYTAPVMSEGKLSYSLYDDSGNKVGQTFVDPGTDMSGAKDMYFTKGANNVWTMSDVPKTNITLDENTGNIKITAPKDVVETDQFKQFIDEDQLKEYSRAYKLNPEYKIEVQEEDEQTGEEKTKQITIPEYISRLNSSLTKYFENLRDQRAYKRQLRDSTGGKSDKFTDEQIVMSAQGAKGAKATYLPDTILGVSSFGNGKANPFESLRNKRGDSDEISAEDLANVWKRENFGREEVAALMAAINGHLEGSDWSGETYYTDADGNLVYNRNSAEEAAKLIAFKNYVLNNNPNAEWYQQAGDWIESAAINFSTGVMNVFANLAVMGEGAVDMLPGVEAKSILNWKNESDETVSNYNAMNAQAWDAIVNAQIWGYLVGTISGTVASSYLGGKLQERIEKHFSTLAGDTTSHIRQISEEMASELGLTGSAAQALSPKTMALMFENGEYASLGARLWLSSLTNYNKAYIAINSALSSINGAKNMSILTEYLYDTIHDAILYDGTTLRNVIEAIRQDPSNEHKQEAINFWIGQFAENAKFWAPIGIAKTSIKLAGKTDLGKAANAVTTRLVNKVAANIGETKQSIKNHFAAGSVVKKLEEDVEKALNKKQFSKANRLQRKLDIENWNTVTREARKRLGNLELKWDGRKLTQESLEEFQKFVGDVKALENGIDLYNRGFLNKVNEMTVKQLDPSTGRYMYLYPELGGANVKASMYYWDLVEMGKKYNLPVAKNSMLNQDVIDYWMNSYYKGLADSFAKSGGENAANAQNAAEILQKNIDTLSEALPQEIMTYVDNMVSRKIYQNWYHVQNEYGVSKGLLNRARTMSYEGNPIWAENGYMPIKVQHDVSGHWVEDGGRIDAVIEQDWDALKFNVAEGQHYVDPEMVRQSRLRKMAQAEINKELFKGYTGFTNNATNVTVISGEETERARIISEGQKALKSEVSKQASASFEEKILGELSIVKNKKFTPNVIVPAETVDNIVSGMSPTDVSEYLSKREVNGKKVINGPQGTITETVTPENYDEWYNSQSKQVRNYLWSKKQGVSEDNPYAGYTEGELNYAKGTIENKMAKKRTSIYYDEKDGADYVGNSKKTSESAFIDDNLEAAEEIPVDAEGEKVFDDATGKGSAYKTKNNVTLYETIDTKDKVEFGKRTRGTYKGASGGKLSTTFDSTKKPRGVTRYVLRKHIPKNTDIFVLNRKTPNGKFLLSKSDDGVFVRTGELDTKGNEIIDVYIGVGLKDQRLKNITPKPKEITQAEELSQEDQRLMKEVFGIEEAKKVPVLSPNEYSKKILSDYKKEQSEYVPEGNKRLAQIEEAREASHVTYEDFSEMARQGGADFEEGLQRAWVLGDPNFAKSNLANEGARNLEAGKEAFYQGTFLAKAKAKLRNIKKVDGNDFVDDISNSIQAMLWRYVNKMLEAPSTKDILKVISGVSDGAEDAAKVYILQELLKDDNFDKASKALDDQIELLAKDRGISHDDVNLMKKTARDILRDTIESECDNARLSAKTLGAELTDSKSLTEEVKALNDKIKAAEGKKDDDYIMYLDAQGRQVYAQVDPAFASLYNTRAKITKADASMMAKFNALASRAFRYGTTSVNLSSFGNQMFRDFGNAILVGGAWQTIKTNADNLREVFGDRIVEQIKAFEPDGYEMRQIEALARETGQSVGEAAVSRELMRGASISGTTTETSLYRDFMRQAYKSDSDELLQKAQSKIQKLWEKYDPDKYMNGKRENYLRNRVYAHSLNDAMNNGFSLSQSRAYAEFAMNNATTNFSRQLYHLQAIADSTPYFRATINGTKSFWRMWSLDPVGISGRVMGGLILPVMFLTGASLGSEENRKVYQNIPEYQKANSLVFVFNGEPVSIPLPQELSPIVSPFRQFVEYLHSSSQNDFWELMMNDLLGFSPYDLTGFTAIDYDRMIEDPTFFDRTSRGLSRLFSQMAPVPLKSAYMIASGTDPYTGKWLRDPSYAYWNDETGSVEIMDDYQSSFALAIAKLFPKINPAIADKVISGVLGTTGSNLLGDFVTLLSGDPGKALQNAGKNIFEQATNPITVEKYNLVDSIWKRAVRQLTNEKEELLHDKKMIKLNTELSTTKDPEKRQKLLAERQDLTDRYKERVANIVERLSTEYKGTFDRQKFAAVVALLNFNTDAGYQSGSQYSSNIASELYWEGRDAAIHTMERMGISGTGDTSIFGYLTTDAGGNVVMRYSSPVAIMDMSSQWQNQSDVNLANIKSILSQNGMYDAHKSVSKQIQSIYDSKDKLTSQDKANIEAIQINWNAQLAKTIAPYVATMTPEAAINNTEVLNALYPYVEVPGSWEVNDKGKGVYLGNRGNKKKAYYESWIKSMFGANDPYKGQY